MGHTEKYLLRAVEPSTGRVIKEGIRKSVWAPGGADDGAHGL